MLADLPVLSTPLQLDEVESFLSPDGPAADVPPLIKARCGSGTPYLRRLNCGAPSDGSSGLLLAPSYSMLLLRRRHKTWPSSEIQTVSTQLFYSFV